MKVVYFISEAEVIKVLEKVWEEIAIRLTHTEILNLPICKN
jgi:hypothetical protein